MLGTASSAEGASQIARFASARAALILLLSISLWAAAIGAAGAATTGSGVSRAQALKDLQRILHSRSARTTGGSAGTPSTSTSTTPKTSNARGAGTAPGATTTPGASTAPGSTGATTTTTTGSVSTLGTLTLTSTAAAHSRATGSTTSTPAIVLAAIAAVLVLLSLIWALARALAYEPSWMPVLRHSFAEAGFRLSGTFAELRDWLRLGR
ncbi:MAG: hypothetical protein WB698_14150 [Solirubrobacteraceae bacterium]